MISYIYLAILGLMLVVLSVYVIRLRKRLKVSLGDGGIVELQRAIRAHGNFAEYTPMFLLLLIACEKSGMAAWLVYVFGTLFLIARAVHFYGITRGEKLVDGSLIGAKYRVLCMSTTFVSIGFLASYLLVVSIIGG